MTGNTCLGHLMIYNDFVFTGKVLPKYPADKMIDLL